jgi:hypothetical protein
MLLRRLMTALFVTVMASAAMPTLASASDSSSVAGVRRELVDTNTEANATRGLLADPLGVIPVAFLGVLQEIHSSPLIEEYTEELEEIFCGGDDVWDVSAPMFTAENQEKVVTVKLVKGGPESITEIKIRPSEWYIATENNCNESYVVGQTCKKVKAKLIVPANGTHPGEVLVRFQANPLLFLVFHTLND